MANHLGHFHNVIFSWAAGSGTFQTHPVIYRALTNSPSWTRRQAPVEFPLAPRRGLFSITSFCISSWRTGYSPPSRDLIQSHLPGLLTKAHEGWWSCFVDGGCQQLRPPSEHFYWPDSSLACHSLLDRLFTPVKRPLTALPSMNPHQSSWGIWLPLRDRRKAEDPTREPSKPGEKASPPRALAKAIHHRPSGMRQGQQSPHLVPSKPVVECQPRPPIYAGVPVPPSLPVRFICCGSRSTSWHSSIPGLLLQILSSVEPTSILQFFQDVELILRWKRREIITKYPLLNVDLSYFCYSIM
jgi:hypothetical protein